MLNDFSEEHVIVEPMTNWQVTELLMQSTYVLL